MERQMTADRRAEPDRMETVHLVNADRLAIAKHE
jgi:hypothetical protein